MSDHEGDFGAEEAYMNDGDDFEQELVEEQQDEAGFNPLDENNVVESGQPLDGEVARAVPKDQRSTTPYMTKYERARILGTRALQIRYVSFDPGSVRPNPAQPSPAAHPSVASRLSLLYADAKAAELTRTDEA